MDARGIEPLIPVCKTGVIPLNYTPKKKEKRKKINSSIKVNKSLQLQDLHRQM